MKTSTHSTDASIFEINPAYVVYPRNQTDLVKTVKNLLGNEQHLTMRAGGTSIAGQAIGSGTIVDVSKHLTNIIKFSHKDKEVVVEPGVIQDDLNDYLKASGLKFAPDTSTSSRAMIGGMIGNNSCGAYSAYYGTTREHVKSIKMLLSDGSVVVFKQLSDLELNDKLKLPSLEGDIYRFVIKSLSQNDIDILKAFPDKSIIRRNTGYAIDELIKNHKPFNLKGKGFSLVPLICGSEGTLGIVISATLNLVEIPKNKTLIVAQFNSESQALKIVNNLMRFNPSAVEFIDKPTLDASKNNVKQSANRSWIKGSPEAVLVVEFFSQKQEELMATVAGCKKWLKTQRAFDCSEVSVEDYDKVWSIRKAGLGLLMGIKSPKKAIAIIEDVAVPLKYLHQYYKEVKIIIESYNIEAVYYGHASVGLIHIRPKLDLSIDSDKKIMLRLSEEVSKLVKKFNGSLSGEHGDGRVRAPYLKDQFGHAIYQILCDLKNTFDPKNLFNPGVIIGNRSITKDLKLTSEPNERLITGFDWSGEPSFFSAVERCNGSGVCRQSFERGGMCPSYQVTRDESFSTRGRANIVRKALSSKNPIKSLNNKEIREALNLCLGCKACATECPANVDMARVKSEYLYQVQNQNDKIEMWRIKHFGKILNAGSKFPKLFNLIQNSRLSRKITNLEGSLPQMQSETLSKWWNFSSGSTYNYSVTVWVISDIYTEFYNSEVGRELLYFLKKCKVNVKLITLNTSIVALISKGLLDEAKQSLNVFYKKLSNIPKQDLIVGIEPSETLVWRDESKFLINKKMNVNLIEELILKLNKLGLLPTLKKIDKTILIHLHCHQKSLVGDQVTLDSLLLIPGLKASVMNSGCCGMAGDFGYLKSPIGDQ